MVSPPPLTGIRVLEFAGLAPGPFAGLLLADFGATVLRIDRPAEGAHTSSPPPATPDNLVRRKSSVAISLKSPGGLALIKSLLQHVDVVIDPYRPGVLEKLGLGPEDVMLKINPRLVVARMTGYRRDGKYKDMAGHDINYIAVSGTLGMLGQKDRPPEPPGNILGDFAGGGAICFTGILLALLARQSTGRGQVVEANMVDGSAYLTTFLRLGMHTLLWSRERGTNVLDGGAPWYQVYETKDGKWMSVGALEPQFWEALLKGLGLKQEDLPGPREDTDAWPKMKELFDSLFRGKTRKEWEDIFDGTDACVAPVLSQDELRRDGFDQRPLVTLKDTPGFAISKNVANGRAVAKGQGSGYDGEGWYAEPLRPGVGGDEVLNRWLGWQQGRQYLVRDGGLEMKEERARL